MFRINNSKIAPISVLQSECPNVFPGLRAIPVWDKNLFSFVSVLEDSFQIIRNEFLMLQGSDSGRGVFQPYRAPASTNPSRNREVDEFGEKATSKGHWNVCYLLLHGMNELFE